MSLKNRMRRRLAVVVGAVMLAGGAVFPVGATEESKPTENTDTAQARAEISDESGIEWTGSLFRGTLVLKNSTQKTQKQIVEETVYQYLSETLKLNTAAICGVLANIQQESNFDPTNTGDSGTSYGLFQWHNSRYTRLKEYCEKHQYDYKTVQGQLRYLKYELQYDGYKHVLQEMREIPNTEEGAYQAAYIWCMKFEIPANRKQKAVARGKIARNTYWKKYHG